MCKTKERNEKEKTSLIYRDSGKQLPRKSMLSRLKGVDEQKQRVHADIPARLSAKATQSTSIGTEVGCEQKQKASERLLTLEQLFA